MTSIGRSSGVLVLVGSFAWAVVAACGNDNGSTFGNGTDSGTETSTGPSFGDPDTGVGTGTFADFGMGAVIDTGDGGAGSATTPANAADLFTAGTAAGGGDGGNGSSPCLAEPEIDSLVPRNWLRPRFSWAGSGGANLFEIRVHASNQTNDLVVYTSATQWIMPRDIWTSFAMHSAGADITISIRGGTLANGALTNVTQGSKGAWGVAPVDAPGSIVYWYVDRNTKLGELKGFSVGDEDTRVVLAPSQVSTQDGFHCVGCHTSTPDGDFALLSSDKFVGMGRDYSIGISSIQTATIGQKPSYATDAAKTAMNDSMQGITSTSAAFWATGKHYVFGTHEVDDNTVNLAVLNLDEPAAAKVLRPITTNKLRQGSLPSSPGISHDGKRIVFSGGGERDGRPSASNDIYTIPFDDTNLTQDATLLAGASATDKNEYYPAFSPDDSLIAFTKTTDDDSYAAEHAEISVITANGGTAQRLAANDPPTCSPPRTTGIENSWPKWAPAGTSQRVNGKTYYWLVFSSTRNTATRDTNTKRQLFMAPVVVDEAGNISQYKAVYLWNQPPAESNHTPAWDVFAIPPSTGGIK